MIRALILLLLLAAPLRAQEFSAVARLDLPSSVMEDARGGVSVDLSLSQAVAWRVFTLDEPRRLILDFREIDWRGVRSDQILNSDLISELRFGILRPGWSRLVADLAEPMAVDSAGMEVDTATGEARLQLRLIPSDAEAFAAAAGAPNDPEWQALDELDVTRAPEPPADDGILTVAIDPGHGGIDPGAQRDGVREADLMLSLGLDLARAIGRTDGMRAVLTRREDVFVPLQARMTAARAAGADVFVSLHADALEIGHAAGASVYVLDPANHDEATERMAQRHGRGDLVAGLDLSDQDDTVAMVLLDLARGKTAPASDRLRAMMIEAFAKTGARLNTRPARAAKLAVLMSADMPSVLIEVGFLSNDADRAALQTAKGRAPLVAGIIVGLRDWAAAEAVRP